MKRTKKSFRFVIVLLLVLSLTLPMSSGVFALDEGSDGSSPTSSNALVQVQAGSDSSTPESADSSEPADASGDLKIVSVQVVNGGAEQDRNRDYVYFIDADVDSSKISSVSGIYQINPDTGYYTSLRSASMTDARIFTVMTEVTYDQLGISDYEEFNPDSLIWTYGGDDLSKWKIYNSKTGKFDGANPAISVITESAIEIDSDSVVIVAKILFDEFYPYFKNYTLNIPYEGFTPIKKQGFPFFVSDPDFLGPHDLAVNYSSEELAKAEIPLNIYDSFHTWDQIDNEVKELYSQSEDANNVINERYVSVTPLYTNTADETERNIWNVVIAKDAQSVTDYLDVTKPLMEYNPEKLKAALSDDDAVKSGYHKIPIYFNNVHPDETPGADAILALIDTFINGDELSYQTQTDSNHVDKGEGYDGYTVAGDDNLTKEVSFSVDDILDKFILVFNVTENPYGKANLIRTNEYGFDLNRDAAYQTQPEAIALTEDLVKWDALSMLEYHGYMDGLLIEPCTGPHDPNYEYDLYQEKMRDQGNAIGKAMIGNTAYYQYLMPATDWNDGWDDGAPIYGPMFAMLFGTMGYTLEIPYTTEDSKEACYSAGLALAYDCLDNRLKYYINKLDYKERCINNEDSLKVDQYLIDPYTGKKIGRPRADGQNFFPEYYVIPVDQTNQRNPLEAYKILQLLNRNEIDLKVTTTPVKYQNKTLPAGTYVVDMHQQGRALVNSLLSEGYDASGFAAIYAELVINHPDMRNFDCASVYESGVFSGKTASVDQVAVPPTSISGTSEQVVIQNDNIDAIRLVNRLLNDSEKVAMLTEDFGKGEMGDFVVNRDALAGYDDLLVYGYPLTGTPNFIQEIEEPNFAIYGYEDHSRFVLDLLEFTGDYVYNPESVSDADVIVDFDAGVDASEAIDEGIGYIGIGYYALNQVEASGLLPGFECFIPDEDTYEPYYEGLVNASYSDNSLITANYDRTDAAYVMNGTYITKAPANGDALITVDNTEDFYKSGWYPDYEVLKSNMLAVYGYANASSPENLSVASEATGTPIVLFANNIFSKAHAQHTYNMFANALFLMASDIDLDTGEKPSITASPESQETPVSSLTVNLTFKGDRDGTEGVENSKSEYKVTTSDTEPLYAEGAAGWIVSATTASIALPTSTDTYYIHAYSENTSGESTQIVFGPYIIGSSGGDGNHSHGGSSAPATTTQPAVTAPSTGFTDIDDHWARTSIEYVVGEKLFSGVSDTLFAPDSTMTRGMLVTVLGRAYGLDTASYSTKPVFNDIPPTAYYAPYVAWAYEKKIVSGVGDGLFAPDKPVTRGEMAAIITNYMKFIGKGTDATADLTYADAANIDSWGLEGVKFVTANGLMTGTSGNNFDFDGLSTRAQVATVMERLLKLIGQ